MKGALSIFIGCLLLSALSVFTWQQHTRAITLKEQLARTLNQFEEARATNQTLITEKQTLAENVQTLQTQLEAQTREVNTLAQIRAELITTQSELNTCQTNLRSQRLPPPPVTPLGPLPSPTTKPNTETKANVELESYLLTSLATTLGSEKEFVLANENLVVVQDSDSRTILQGTADTATLSKTLHWHEGLLEKMELDVTGSGVLEIVRTTLAQLGDLQPFDGKETLFVKDGLVQLTPQNNGVTILYQTNFLRDLPMVTN
jgi:cell division protein FtsL